MVIKLGRFRLEIKTGFKRYGKARDCINGVNCPGENVARVLDNMEALLANGGKELFLDLQGEIKDRKSRWK